jgi:hypothetical protein
LPELHLIDGEIERRIEPSHCCLSIGGLPQALLPDRVEKAMSLLRVVEIDVTRALFAAAPNDHRIGSKTRVRFDVKENWFKHVPIQLHSCGGSPSAETLPSARLYRALRSFLAQALAQKQQKNKSRRGWKSLFV